MKRISEPSDTIRQAQHGARARTTLGAGLHMVCISVFAAALLGEVVVRVASRVLHRIPIVAADARMGWVGWPNLRRAAKTYRNGTFHLTTDSLGRRISSATPSAAIAADAPVILLVGDSFTQGVGVDDEATFGWQLAHALPSDRIVNLGVAGYGSDQELLAVEQFLQQTPSQVGAIVVLTYENDFRDVQSSFDFALGRSKPRFRWQRGIFERPTYSPGNLDRWMDRSRLLWFARTSLMYRFRPLESAPETGVDLVVACLDAIKELGSAAGIPVHLLAYRQPGSRSEVSDDVWLTFLARTGAMDLTPAIQVAGSPDPIGFDGLHWSAEGHRRAALSMLESLHTNRRVDTPSGKTR